MEHGPGTEGNGRDTTRRNADPGATAIDVVALVHWNKNEIALDRVRPVRE